MRLGLFQHNWHPRLALLATAEWTVLFYAPFLAGAVRFGVAPAEVDEVVVPIALGATVFAGIVFLSMAAMGLYHARQRARFIGWFSRIAAGIIAGMLLTGMVFYLAPQLYFGRGILLGAALIAFAGSTSLRTLFARFIDEGVFKRRVIVFGSGQRAASLRRLRRRSDRRGFVILGHVTAAGETSASQDQEMLGDSTHLVELCNHHAADEIVVAMDDRRQNFPTNELLQCRMTGIEVTDLLTFLERETGKVRLDVLHPSWMIFSDGFRRSRLHALLERMFDVSASLVVLGLTMPVTVLTAIAIKLENGGRGSVFYRQVRVGQNDKPFSLIKFRSMREDAENDGVARWADMNDSRITRVGALIRKTRIDELPQVINVLRGEMSFVGPRPERPEFVSQFVERIPYYRERHVVKPGITGWAQLCYPYGSSYKDAIEKLQYDLYYVKNHSLLFYLAILLQTVEVIVWRKGAR